MNSPTYNPSHSAPLIMPYPTASAGLAPGLSASSYIGALPMRLPFPPITANSIAPQPAGGFPLYGAMPAMVSLASTVPGSGRFAEVAQMNGESGNEMPLQRERIAESKQSATTRAETASDEEEDDEEEEIDVVGGVEDVGSLRAGFDFEEVTRESMEGSGATVNREMDASLKADEDVFDAKLSESDHEEQDDDDGGSESSDDETTAQEGTVEEDGHFVGKLPVVLAIIRRTGCARSFTAMQSMLSNVSLSPIQARLIFLQIPTTVFLLAKSKQHRAMIGRYILAIRARSHFSPNTR